MLQDELEKSRHELEDLDNAVAQLKAVSARLASRVFFLCTSLLLLGVGCAEFPGILPV